MEINKILIIIRRSNGDVFLSEPLIRELKKKTNAIIDILINKDTLAIAKTLPYINKIYTFDYSWSKLEKFIEPIKLFWKLFKKYDLSISLTSNDRDVRYAAFSAKYSISVIEKDIKKNWWKKLILNNYYFYRENQHIVLQNLIPLKFLQLNSEKIEVKSYYNSKIKEKLKKQYPFLNSKFIIFHPSAQYKYKIYPKHLRDKLLNLLNTLEIPIIITGGKSKIDNEISKEIPKMKNIFNLIGKTTLEEFIAMSDMSMAYIGMDTLNMHIAASQNKYVFAIFGPSLNSVWSPWSNICECYAKENTKPLTIYENIYLFQADMECVPCGKAGCNDKGGISECLYYIKPDFIFKKVKECLLK
jgi:heptosyltransferase-3